MPIVLNTNASATEATFNLNKANDNLRRSIARLSSGSRITKPTDDAGGLAVAYKLQSSISRTEAALNNHQNALSYLQVQDGVLEAIGEIVDRMAELRTLSADVSKSISDVENYSKEFVELQDQLNQMKREKFNGVELFAVEEEWHDMKGMTKSHLKINGADYVNDGSDAVPGQNAISLGTKATYEYFDHPDQSKRTVGQYDKYEFQLYTHPTGVEEDGNIKLNVVNLQFMLGIKDPSAFGVDKTQTWEGSEIINTLDNVTKDGLITGAEWTASGYDNGTGTENDGIIDAGEVAAFEAANPGWIEYTNESADLLAANPTWDGLDGGAIDGSLEQSEILAGLAAAGHSDLTDPAKVSAALLAIGADQDGDGTLNSYARITSAPALYTEGTGSTVSISNTINLAGLNQRAVIDPNDTTYKLTLDPDDGSVHLSNKSKGVNYSSWLNDDGYIKDITKISVEEFTNIIEKIADARAENGAEQQRVAQSVKLHEHNLVNLQAAHGRIMDVDVAMESTRLARHSVTVQASAAMVAQANQMTAIALTLLSQ
jgi:flagellin-like hook-associated protein FlgL